MRFIKCALLCCLLAALARCAYAEEPPVSSPVNPDLIVSTSLSGRGLTSTVTLRVDNRTGTDLTLRVLDIALNSECTGYTAAYEITPGITEKALTFQRRQLIPVTVCDLAYEILDSTGKVLQQSVRTLHPFSPSTEHRPAIDDYPRATVALDNSSATLLILPPENPANPHRILCLLNKSSEILRVRTVRLTADGQLLDSELTMQALPLTVQYAELLLPDPLPEELKLTLNGYFAGKGDQPVFSEHYTYNLSAPESVPTVIPVNTPSPEIGTVTIRRSGNVNIREKDSTDSKKIGSAKAGQTYPCYGVSQAGWYLIRLEDGTEGYVTNTLTTFHPKK